jgi:hypothetical protein
MNIISLGTKNMFNWLIKRILSPKRLNELIETTWPTIEKLVSERSSDIVKATIHKTLEDPEIGEHVVQYTDAIYDRYLGKGGKLWASIGGRQKGLNAAMDKVNPMNALDQLVDEDGNFSIAGAIKGYLRGAFTQNPSNQERGSEVF